MHKKALSISRAAFALCLVIAASVALSGCLGFSADPQVAAVVAPGTSSASSIPEADVTDYIEGFREKNESCETDAGWAQWLSDNGYTAETLRTYVLNTVFAPKEVVRIEAKKLELSVSDEELDGVIATEKEYYEQRYGADSWKSVLSSYGYDETTWRENEESRLLEERLKAEVIDPADPTSSQVQAYAVDAASSYSGKHSYCIEFSSYDDAQAALKKMGGTLATVKFKRFKKFGQIQDAGWSSLKASQDGMSSEYTNALNDLEEGHVSEPVVEKDTDGNEHYLLIYCKRIFLAPENGVINIDDIPGPILKQLREDTAAQLEDEEFEDWLEDATAELGVEIYDMPEGLPYDVNVSVSAE